MRKADLDPNPFRQFEKWFDEARAGGESLPEAMALATASLSGHPSVRMVLLKGIHKEGFEFYTNLISRKSQELEENPRAALVFWWSQLQRQVRAEGIIERIDSKDADEYFRNRSRESQIGAWASRQSQQIPDREELERCVQEYEKKLAGREAPRPPFWGGFRLIPENIEFWQEQPGRLHDRLLYRKSADQDWILERLAP